MLLKGTKMKKDEENKQRKLSRREFLEGTIFGALGIGIGVTSTPETLVAKEEKEPDDEKKEKEPHIKEYRKLGRTGWKVSDISFGNAMIKDPSLLEYAMERGINYVDTARQYFDMEVVIGKLFPAKRDKLFVTTKLMPELVTPTVSEEKIIQGIEESLKRLNTDYIDCVLIHSVGDPTLGDRTRIENQNIYSAFEKAREQGKIRFWGASSHGPKMIEDFTWLIENTEIDMIMPGMNFMTRGIEPVLKKARQKGIAIVAMKSLSAARKINYKPYMKKGDTVRQAVLKWMLAQPNIDTIAISMRSLEMIDEYVAVSGSRSLSKEEEKLLQGYGKLLNSDYCRPGCSSCLGKCPFDVPIHDILRYKLYFENYGLEKYAITLYSKLPDNKKAVICHACSAHCEGSCPYNLSIKNKLIEAHSELIV